MPLEEHLEAINPKTKNDALTIMKLIFWEKILTEDNIERNIAMELVRVTGAAAMAAAHILKTSFIVLPVAAGFAFTIRLKELH